MGRGMFRLSPQLKKVVPIIHAAWLLMVITSVGINKIHSNREFEQNARTVVQTIFERDMAYRKWFSEYGGAYVKVTPKTPPNPFLGHIVDREIHKPDGTLLTLINPAYLMRLIGESTSNIGATASSRMTSLKPLRPENAPDAWESAALERLARGEQQIFEFTTSNGEPYLRYLHAAPTKEPCLRCHASQGYRVGDLRGGLSITLPLGRQLATHNKTLHTLFFWHLLIYLFGASLLVWGQKLLSRRVQERDLAIAALEESESNFRTVADFAHAWEYWVNPNGEMRYVSPSVKEITGYGPDRFLANPDFFKGIIAEEDRDIVQQHVAPAQQEGRDCALDFRIRTASGEIRWLHHICRPIHGRDGTFMGRRASNYDITEEKTAKLRNEELISKLREALEKVKILSGFLPICASCKKIRDDQGYWNQIEAYISHHSEATFSHGICPDCAHRLYPEYYPAPENGAAASERKKPAPK
ncbi:MAG: DUF3365 domain-containing protein [Desulfobulbaceae bacterium]|nr:DUF3365 domain-containing protein [Desulfobulbaceae bacterium]